ncbi:hypothetical protein TNCV_4742791 [Trichonephila clavipes]|nr:hypothetical protein TNCV_4742791 [Trichonephila clavipes]
MGRQLRVQRPPIHNISDLHDRCLNIWYTLSPAIYQGLVNPCQGGLKLCCAPKRWVGIKASKRNCRRDPNHPSARCDCMVREDTCTPIKDATCAWMVADEAVGCTRAFSKTGGLL